MQALDVAYLWHADVHVCTIDLPKYRPYGTWLQSNHLNVTSLTHVTFR
jgi:hypothetical protein